MGELVSLSQEFKTNKRFVSALVRRRLGTMLPMELKLNLGMRKYLLLLTNDRGEQTSYRPDLGHFVLMDQRRSDDFGLPARKENYEKNYEIRPTEKGKRPVGESNGKEPEGLVKLGSRPGDGEILIRFGKESRPICLMNKARYTLQGNVDSNMKKGEPPAMVERGSHVGGSDGPRRDNRNVVEHRSHVIEGMESPRLLVHGPTGRNELRGGTVGHSTDGTDLKRKDKTKIGPTLSGSTKPGFKKWVARGKKRSELGGPRTATEIMGSEVVGSQGCRVIGETEVLGSMWLEEKREVKHVAGSELIFVDPLENEARLRLDSKSADGLMGIGLERDVFIECEMGLFVDRPTILQVNAKRV